jgi:hypothetical protein
LRSFRQQQKEADVRDFTHRILSLAGTTLLAAAVIYGAPSTPAHVEHDPVRVAAATDLLAVVTPIRAALKLTSRHRSDTVKPNGASCPGADSAPLLPSPGIGSAENSVQNAQPPVVPNGKVASPCPASGNDARTDIVRGPALATPEPLNSKHLIAPREKMPG